MDHGRTLLNRNFKDLWHFTPQINVFAVGINLSNVIKLLQMNRTQRNKATMGHLGLLKARLAKLRRELIEPKGGGGGGGEAGFDVAKTGDARIGFVGALKFDMAVFSFLCCDSESDEFLFCFVLFCCDVKLNRQFRCLGLEMCYRCGSSEIRLIVI